MIDEDLGIELINQMIVSNKKPMRSNMYKFIATLILTFSAVTVLAQSYSIVQEESEMMVIGTSNVHDWEAPAEEFSGSAEIEVADDSLVTISSLNFTVIAKEINSGKGGMDSRIDDALKVKKNPEISYVLSEINEVKNGALIASGKLTIAGVTKDVQMEVNYELQEDGSVLFEGTQTINMVDYDVSPPTAMFGTIKAGEKVDVKFNVKFAQ